MKILKFTFIVFELFTIIFCVNILGQNTLSENSSLPEIKNWQIKGGVSFNNESVFNVEGSYIIPISQAFQFSLDTRIYSYLTISPSLKTRSIEIIDKMYFYLKFGLGFNVFGIIPFTNFATELSLAFIYKLNDNVNLLIEYKQAKYSSAGFETLFSRNMIDNFPIRFISIGVEI